ncbi:MAG: ATP-binding protein [Polaromonas sp.]|uniref:sensor histidine kinase n=1 Tax=Polaromonas sp. TaxID=1869339 RepID=UPI002734F0BF|nr:ATP-binding protein [Polaromonas sp.]MDP2819014.1 ATP-binding protein [Polaromonas sp.]
MQSPLTVFRAWLRAVRPGRRRPTSCDAGADGSEAASIEALQAGLELATQGIIVLDAGWTIVALNSHAQSLIRSFGASLPGTEFWEAVPDLIAENHRSVSEQALRGGFAHAFVVHDSFEDQWVEYSLRPHGCGTVVNLRDVSDTRQAQLLLQGSEGCNKSLFDGNTQAMWLLDADSRHVLALNKAAAVFYGLPGGSVAMPQVEAFFPEGEAVRWLTSLPAGDFQQQMRVCTQRKITGELVLVELACSTVKWFERPARLVSVVDVGARHFADSQLQRLNDTLEQRIAQCSADLQRSRDELGIFTHAMSDFLKAPLHVVSGFATMLAERYSAALDPLGRHYLARIRVSTRQLAKLIDDVRTLAHLPGVVLNREQVNLAPLCRRLIEDWRKREPQRQLVLEIAQTLPVFGDKNLLVTAVDCLMDNAWKFTAKKEQGWIKVALMPGASPQHSVLMVADNGAGFDAAYADKLFTAFQRLHSSADFPGGGLGLAIVKRVTERHGGAVWATTTDNGGASFFMSLPQAPQDDGATEVPRLPPPDQAG